MTPILRSNGITLYGTVGKNSKLENFEVHSKGKIHGKSHQLFTDAERAYKTLVAKKTAHVK